MLIDAVKRIKSRQDIIRCLECKDQKYCDGIR